MHIRIFRIMAGLAMLLAAPCATRAANQFWDAATTAGYQHSNGVWSTADVGWSVNGTAALTVWTNNNKANFSGTGGSSLITLSNSVATTGILVNGSAYILSLTNGGQLTNTLFNVVVGFATSGNRVELSGGGATPTLWDNGGRAFNLGYGNSTRTNAVLIDGKGIAGSAVMTNISQLLVGTDAAFGSPAVSNSVTVTAGGRLHLGAFDHIIGGQSPAAYYESFSNRLEITAGGWVLSTGQLYIGKTAASYQGNHRGNRLVIRDAGSLLDMKGTNITVGYLVGGGGAYYVRDNELLIDGGLVTNVALLTISSGSGGGVTCVFGNGLVVTNGGRLCSRGAVRIGMTSNNWGIVSGANSLWDLGGSTLTIGAAFYYGVSNYLTINQGASVLAVGTATVYPSNDLSLLGGTLAVSNLTSTKGSLFVAGDGFQSASLFMNAGTVSNSAGIRISSNAVVLGNGRLMGGSGVIEFASGSALVPGSYGSPSSSVSLVQISGDAVWQGGVTLDLNVTNVAGAAGTGWDAVRVAGNLRSAPGTGKIRIRLNSLGETAGGFNPNVARIVNLVDFSSSSLTASDFEVNTNQFLIGSNWFLEVTATDVRYVYRRASPFLYVSPTGNNNGGTNWTTAYSTLTNALAFAQNYDTIYMAGRTFDITSQVSVVSRVQLSILGGYEAASDAVLPGPQDPAAWPTVIQRSAGITRIMYLSGLTNSVLKNLTLQNGSMSVAVYAGGGAYVTSCSGLTMDSCTVSNNSLSSGNPGGQLGGGIYAESSTLTLTNCLITRNTSTGTGNGSGHGGGLYLFSGAMTMTASRVTQNTATGAGAGAATTDGGGLYIAAAASCLIQRSVIDRNTNARNGGGFYIAGAAQLVNDLVIQNNSGTDLGDGFCLNGGTNVILINQCTIADNGAGVGVLYVSGAAFVTNSIVWGHGDDLKGFPIDGQVPSVQPGVAMTCTRDADNLGRNGCLSIDPLFADTNYYHLQSRQGVYAGGFFSEGTWATSLSNSPCIDVGEALGLDSPEPAPNGGRRNLGAYGNTAVASLSDITSVFTPPAIVNRGAIAVGHRTVRLLAEVTDTGDDSPMCGFDYWIEGGPTSSASAGKQTGAFELNVGGLTPGVSYRFTAFASNAVARTGSVTNSFSTHPVPVALYAATNGLNTSGTNWTTAYTNLPDALAILEDGDTLYLAGHSFAYSPVYQQASLLTWDANRDVTVRGGYAATDNAVLPGAQNPRLWPTVLTRASGNSRILMASALTNCVLRDVTIQNGFFNKVQTGGGAYLVGCSNLTLQSCTIISNVINASGGLVAGGLYVGSGFVTILDSSISSNSLMGIPNADAFGGALYLNAGSTTTVARTLIEGNLAQGANQNDGYGGGLYIKAGALASLNRVVIRRNRTFVPANHPLIRGGGGINNGGQLSMVNCIIDHNIDGLTSCDGIVTAGSLMMLNCTLAHNNNGVGIRYTGGSVALTNCIVWGHTNDLMTFPSSGGILSNVYFSCIGNGYNNGVQDCFASDPLFVDTNYYHLQSRAGQYQDGYFSGGTWGTGSAGSPCIDKGDGRDYSLEPAPNGSRINLGAYGNTEVASRTRGLSGVLILVN